MRQPWAYTALLQVPGLKWFDLEADPLERPSPAADDPPATVTAKPILHGGTGAWKGKNCFVNVFDTHAGSLLN